MSFHRKRLSNRPCETCKADTLHYDITCSDCGTIFKMADCRINTIKRRMYARKGTTATNIKLMSITKDHNEIKKQRGETYQTGDYTNHEKHTRYNRNRPILTGNERTKT